MARLTWSPIRTMTAHAGKLTDCDVDLLPIPPASSRGDARAVQVPRRSPAVDRKSLGEFVHGGAVLITADQFGHLIIE